MAHFSFQILILACLNGFPTEALPQLDQLLSQGGSLLSSLIRHAILTIVAKGFMSLIIVTNGVMSQLKQI